VNVGVLGYLGTVTAARMTTTDGHDVERGDVGPPEVDEIWAVSGRQRRVRPTRPHRGLGHSSRRSALCTAESIRRFSLISARKRSPQRDIRVFRPVTTSTRLSSGPG
jgi:hypothetical protein